ncbi:hypothetical protein X777_13084 [Ooceraea biroi]|uniref:Uncharacterized protein n=1 Tax=Ooceraea biroi TaxID=2015173 RepID=A0A026WXW5_OOCBI|nr:hypothetical protein X777_13084 [Ooceraea biroi]
MTPPSSSPRVSERRVSASNSSSSSSSSPSDLRRRLEDLPSPNEFTLLADRVATLGRRISRKRELFLRLHGVATRIEENDEWEEREQRAGSDGSSGVFRSKDARARRRARIRLETSTNGDKTMVISQTDNPTAPSKTTDSENKSNPIETTVDQSARDRNYLQSSMIEEVVSRRQPRPTSLSEPSSTRSAHHNNVTWQNTKPNANFHSFRNFTSRDRASRSVDLPSVAPFSLSNVRPKKFGGYRPSSGMILKNLSSGSESESANETNRGQSCVQNIGGPVAALELSSPDSKSTADNGPSKKMPIMSARSDITRSILPNLLPSTRSLHDNNIGNPISQEGSRTAYIAGQSNCNESSIRFPNQVENITRDAPAKAFYNKQASCDKLSTKIPNESWHIAAKYECDEKEETSQNTLSFSARSLISESAELVTSAYNEQINRNLLNNYDKFKQGKGQFEDEHNEQEEEGSYCTIVPKIRHDELKDRCSFNHSTGQPNVEANFSETDGKHVFDAAKWDQMTNFYTNETVGKPDLIERARTGVTEDALSSEISEPFGSEDHSRSSYATKMCLKKDVFSNRRSQNDTDVSEKYDQEIITVTDVPALALNSQDISYSTSAGSRECPAMRPLDPHALIKALSDVSLKQERQDPSAASRKRDDLYRLDNDTNAASSGVPDFPVKGETWRVPRSSTSGSPKRPLMRVPSRIPIRICRSYKNSEILRRVANNEEQFIDEDNVQNKKPRDESTEVAIVEAHSSRFSSDDGVAKYGVNDYKTGSLISSNQQSPRTPFGNEMYDKMERLSNSRFNENCPAAFFNETSYLSNQDYAKIDDDVRSKSDRSTSRKSMETVDITSATGSSYLPKYKHDLIPKNESSRNVEENATWRTEDECASINNEEEPENLKNKDYYDSYSNKTEGMYLQTKEHFESEIGEIYDWPPAKSQLPQIDLSLKIERIVRKQSRVNNDPNFDNDEQTLHHNLELTKVSEAENLTSQMRRTQELCSLATKMSSSMLNLNYEPKKKKKKSQERLPFTISEVSGALSAEHVDTSDYQLSDKHFRSKMDDLLLQEKTVHRLKAHPSITRLASSGLEDTVEEILCCVAQEQQENESSSKSRMRALLRIFSSKLRKSSKQRNDNRTAESTKIIYENRACQVDSKTNSCSSDDSSAEEARRLSLESSNNRWIDHSSMLVSDRNILKKTESLEVITQEHSRRKYDRDNLWVQDIKDSLFSEDKDDKMTREKGEEDDSNRNPKDQYSIFLAKDFQSDKLSRSNNDHNSRKGEQADVPTSSHLIPADGKDKGDVGQKASPNVVPEAEEIEEDLTGCLCLRLCRLLTPSGYRLSFPAAEKKEMTLQRFQAEVFRSIDN